MTTKHAHIIRAMRLPSVPVVFPDRVATVEACRVFHSVTPVRICACCYLPIIGNSDTYCHRKTCLDIRAAAARQREIELTGQYILHWETFDAESDFQRFDDLGELLEHAEILREQVADIFVINPDGTTVLLTF